MKSNVKDQKSAKRRRRQDFMFMDQQAQTLFKPPGSINGNAFIMDKLNQCTIAVLDHCNQVTVDDCNDSRIFIGPADGSVFIRNCHNCHITVACRQFRTVDCSNCTIRLYCATADPIIETSSNMLFLPFNAWYPGLATQFERATLDPQKNHWRVVYDFNDSNGEGKDSKQPLQHYIIGDQYSKQVQNLQADFPHVQFDSDEVCPANSLVEQRIPEDSSSSGEEKVSDFKEPEDAEPEWLKAPWRPQAKSQTKKVQGSMLAEDGSSEGETESAQESESEDEAKTEQKNEEESSHQLDIESSNSLSEKDNAPPSPNGAGTFGGVKEKEIDSSTNLQSASSVSNAKNEDDEFDVLPKSSDNHMDAQTNENRKEGVSEVILPKPETLQANQRPPRKTLKPSKVEVAKEQMRASLSAPVPISSKQDLEEKPSNESIDDKAKEDKIEATTNTEEQEGTIQTNDVDKSSDIAPEGASGLVVHNVTSMDEWDSLTQQRANAFSYGRARSLETHQYLNKNPSTTQAKSSEGDIESKIELKEEEKSIQQLPRPANFFELLEDLETEGYAEPSSLKLYLNEKDDSMYILDKTPGMRLARRKFSESDYTTVSDMSVEISPISSGARLEDGNWFTFLFGCCGPSEALIESETLKHRSAISEWSARASGMNKEKKSPEQEGEEETDADSKEDSIYGSAGYIFAPFRKIEFEHKRIQVLASTKWIESSTSQWRMLSSLYTRMRPASAVEPARRGEHWESIGFQGDDPATDLRGTGIYGITQLLYLFQYFPNLGIALITTSQEQPFPVVVSGFNLTALVLRFLRASSSAALQQLLRRNVETNDRISQVLVNAAYSLDAFAGLVFSASYAEFLSQWKQRKCHVQEFSTIKDHVGVCLRRAPYALIKRFLEKWDSSYTESALEITSAPSRVEEPISSVPNNQTEEIEFTSIFDVSKAANEPPSESVEADPVPPSSSKYNASNTSSLAQESSA